MHAQRLGWLILFVSSLLMAVVLLLKPNFSAYAREPINPVPSRLTVTEAHPADLRSTADITFTPAYTAYLPFISNPKPPAGIYGRITYQGVPVTHTQVALWRCDYENAAWLCRSTNRIFTTTDETGQYQFTTAASLQANQKYHVGFSASDARYLSWWTSFDILTYAAGQVVAGGDFDVADVPLVAPASGVTVTLPLNFQWVPRAATPTDNYQVGLVNFDTGDNWYLPYVGYNPSYLLTTPPPGFVAGAQFAWGVWVTSPNGGSGLSKAGNTFTVGE